MEAPAVNIDLFPLIVASTDSNQTNCSVCYDNFVPNQTQVRQLPCGHIFHDNCIRSWTENAITCPLCRYELPRNEARSSTSNFRGNLFFDHRVMISRGRVRSQSRPRRNSSNIRRSRSRSRSNARRRG